MKTRSRVEGQICHDIWLSGVTTKCAQSLQALKILGSLGMCDDALNVIYKAVVIPRFFMQSRRFTFGGVIAESVNAVLLPRRVFPNGRPIIYSQAAPEFGYLSGVKPIY